MPSLAKHAGGRRLSLSAGNMTCFKHRSCSDEDDDPDEALLNSSALSSRTEYSSEIALAMPSKQGFSSSQSTSLHSSKRNSGRQSKLGSYLFEMDNKITKNT